MYSTYCKWSKYKNQLHNKLVIFTQFLQYFSFQSSGAIMLLNAKTKGRDAVEQPEGFNHKLLVFKEMVAVTGDIQRDCPALSLLWVWRATVCCHLN